MVSIDEGALAHQYPVDIPEQWEFVEPGQNFLVLSKLPKEDGWVRFLALNGSGKLVILSAPFLEDFAITR